MAHTYKIHMRRKYITPLIAITAIAVLFFSIYRISKKPPAAAPEKPKQPISVTVQSAAASTSLVQKIEYPATIVGDQEIKITAKAGGTAQEVSFDLGDKVSMNATLVKIDDTGNNLRVGDEGFRSAQIRQSELSVDQYEEQLKTARKTYNKLNNAYQTQKKNTSLTKTVSKAQLIAAKGQVELAKVQLENAKVGLKGSLDDHLITSPISGYVTNKSVSVGDSITLGQQLLTISKTSNMKIQFFVDQDQLSAATEGTQVNVTLSNGDSFPATIKNISPDADAATKRFLIEAFPEGKNPETLMSGTIATVSFSFTTDPRNAGDLILPLSAITIGQNESYLFLNDNGRAEKTAVTVRSVSGESAEVKADIPRNAMIIINGSKLVADGDPVLVK